VSRGVDGYTILRKEGGAPSSVSDGTVAAKVTGTSYDDLSAPVGMEIFYAIYTNRGGVHSQKSVLSTSVTVIADVQNLQAEADDSTVTLKWQIPGQILGVQVIRRTDRPPHGPDDGDRIDTTGQNSVKDSSVKNGVTYYYGVYCLYKCGSGKTLHSSGAITNARPEPLPKPVNSLNTTLVGNSVHITWEKPETGDVIILRSVQPLNIERGSSLPKSKIDSLAQSIHSIGVNEAKDDEVGSAVRYYTAITVGSQMAVVGETHKFACIPDALATRIECNAGTLQAYWKWPQETTIAVAAWRSDIYPQSGTDAKARTTTISKSDFDRLGRLTIPNNGATECYFAVFVGVRTADGDIYASGQSDGARAFYSGSPPVSLSYTVSKKLFNPKRQLVFSAERPCKISGLILVAKPGMLPVDVTDGTIVQRLPEMDLDNKGCMVEMPSSPKGYFVKAFFENPQEYERFLVNHPAKEDLRIG
jgi:hypothetical protein